jgi:MFS family permease
MPLSGRVADTPHCKKTLITCLLIIGISLALLGLVRNIILFTLLFLLETIAFSFMLPAGMKIFGNNVANHPQRGNIIGSVAGLTELCAMLVPIILLPLYRMDATLPWSVLGVLSIIITFPFWQYHEAPDKG